MLDNAKILHVGGKASASLSQCLLFATILDLYSNAQSIHDAGNPREFADH